MKSTLLASLLITSFSSVFAQTNPVITEPTVTVAAPCIAAPKKPKNVILLIGDGTGLAQWSAAQASTKDNLQVFNLVEHIGLSKTSSSSHWVTDSGAGATAFSIGEKTFNKAIGVRADSTPAFTLSEMLHVKGKGTGLVATCGLTHATPASFYAHQVSRYMDKEIANDFYSGFIDVAIGGGYPWFDSAKLSQAGYQRFVCTKDSLHKINSSKFIAFYDKSNDVPKVRDGRGDFLTDASMAAIRNLSQNPNGFFLMIEGSQIDWGGHDNDADYVITEALDFDKTIGAIGAWAKENGETLVIITADHETGGLTIPGYDKTAGRPVSLFSTKDHTGIPVPVFSFGPGSEAFKGVYENNTIHQKILQAFGE
jgi:alkaline phosphatase